MSYFSQRQEPRRPLGDVGSCMLGRKDWCCQPQKGGTLKVTQLEGCASGLELHEHNKKCILKTTASGFGEARFDYSPATLAPTNAGAILGMREVPG